MGMVKWFESRQRGVLFVSLGHDDLLLETLRRVAREADVHTGIVMTGVGSLSRGRIHWVATNEMPPRNEFADLEGPLEVVGMSGIIAAYEPHVHIALQDGQGRFRGGHLEEGCVVLTLAEVSVMRSTDILLGRRERDGSAFPLLDREG